MLAILGAAFTAYYLTPQIPKKLWFVILVPMLAIGFAVVGAILAQVMAEYNGFAPRPGDVVLGAVVNAIWGIIFASVAVLISLWRHRRKTAEA